VGISGCGAGAVPSKQAKQTSKCLVLGAGAVAVVLCYAKVRCCAVVGVVRVYTNKQRLSVWCCAVLGAKQGCKANKPSKAMVWCGC
jgi:hypothetical protein